MSHDAKHEIGPPEDNMRDDVIELCELKIEGPGQKHVPELIIPCQALQASGITLGSTLVHNGEDVTVVGISQAPEGSTSNSSIQ